MTGLVPLGSGLVCRASPSQTVCGLILLGAYLRWSTLWLGLLSFTSQSSHSRGSDSCSGALPSEALSLTCKLQVQNTSAVTNLKVCWAVAAQAGGSIQLKASVVHLTRGAAVEGPSEKADIGGIRSSNTAALTFRVC